MNLKLINNSKNSGQVVILLLLIMVVALAIGLSTIGRSILEVSTSRKSEDSSRAFSAAEAGIESAIKQNENNIGGSTVTVSTAALTNQTTTLASGYGLPISNNALGWSSRTKSDFAQFWLADPNNINVQGYTGSSFVLYFGDPNPKIGYFSNSDMNDSKNPINDQPAIEVNIIYWDGSANAYKVTKKNFDSKQTPPGGIFAPRIGVNPDCYSSYSSTVAFPTNNSDQVKYYCKVTANFADFVPPIVNNLATFPVMVRVRLLYTNIPHPIALMPTATGFPKQANVYKSSGTSGNVQRTLEAAIYRAVMPQFFDYAVFSAADLSKILP